MIAYRGRCVTDEQIAFIRQRIQERPGISRWKLSRDGRTLRIEREIESLGGESEGTFIYERRD